MNAPELFSLKNRVAVVLGGTSGIGLAIAMLPNAVLLLEFLARVALP